MTKGATIHEIADGPVTVQVAALIGGDGIDLVLIRPGHRSITVQLSMEAANRLAETVAAASQESAELTL